MRTEHLSLGAAEAAAGVTVLAAGTLGVISNRRKSSLLKFDLVNNHNYSTP